MSIARIVPALRIELSSSRQLTGLLSCAHLGAVLIVIALLPVAPWLPAVLLLVIPSWFWTLRKYALLRAPRSIVTVELKNEIDCALQMRNGDWLIGRMLPSSYALPWLIVVHVACDQWPLGLCVLLFPDSVSPDMHRRLRVRLRWARYHTREDDVPEPPL